MARVRRGSSTPSPKPAKAPRPLRARPTPRWVAKRDDLDEMARRRCLMVLSVLSGEKPVTEVITELGISRPAYYQLETKALMAMLAALAPGAVSTSEAAIPTRRIAQLETQVNELVRDKRRLERLLYLTRKLVKPGPVTAGPGRTARPGSMTSGRRPLRSSKTTSPTGQTSASGSTPTPAGATTP